MIGSLFAVITCAGILFLFWLDRSAERLSKATWLPTIWLIIASSRPVSSWMTFSSPNGPYDSYVDGSPFDRNVLMLLLALACWVLYGRFSRVAGFIRVNAPILVFLLYCGVSAVWADYPFVVLKRWIRTIGDIVMLLIILTDPNWTEALKRVLMRVGYVLIPLSLLFIRFFPSLGRAYSPGGAPMWTGVGTDKNALGALCMLFGVALLWRGLTLYADQHAKFRNRQLLTIGGLFAMVLYLVLIVDSKTALACFALAGVLIVLTQSRFFRKPALVSVMMLTMISACYAVLFGGIGGGALETLGRNSSLTGRTEVWNIVLPFAVNPWIGAGYENFWIGDRLRRIIETLGSGLNQAHNGYIEIYLNIGWVGLFLLGLVFLFGYRNVMRSLRQDPEMGRLKLAFFFMCLVYNFTEAAFKMMSPVWITFLWATLNTPRPKLRRKTSPTFDPEFHSMPEPPGLMAVPD